MGTEKAVTKKRSGTEEDRVCFEIIKNIIIISLVLRWFTLTHFNIIKENVNVIFVSLLIHQNERERERWNAKKTKLFIPFLSIRIT